MEVKKKISRKELITLLGNLEGEDWSLQRKINRMLTMLFTNEGNVPVSIEWYLEGMKLEEVVNRPVRDVYVEYAEWCELNYLPPEKIILFGKFVRERFPVESIQKKLNGENIKYYVKKRL